MSYRWVEHTGELELELDAESKRGIFEAAFEAMRELLAAKSIGESVTRRIELVAGDRAALLADWMGELAFLAETDGLVPARLRRLELSDVRLEAEVETVPADPPHLVKAATYHRLALAPDGERWRGRVVLDV